jgi:alpha-tubulin suppressor-like RCC1 family protein
MTGGSELFANQRIRLAAAGALHLAVVAEDSAVYSCGYSDNVRLGLGDEQRRRRRLTRVRQAVVAGSRVMMVACGGHHPMAGDGGGTRRHCACERERARESVNHNDNNSS